MFNAGETGERLRGGGLSSGSCFFCELKNYFHDRMKKKKFCRCHGGFGRIQLTPTQSYDVHSLVQRKFGVPTFFLKITRERNSNRAICALYHMWTGCNHCNIYFQHMIIVQILVGIYYLYWVVKYLFIYSSVFFYLFVYYFIYRYQQFDFLFQSELREILINYRQISWLLTDKMHICIFVSRSEQNVMFIYNTCTCINELPY